SLVTRAAFFTAWAIPFLRNHTSDSSSLPLQASRAFLQSIMGAPVRSRSLRTCSALMFGFLPPSGAVVVIVSSVFMNTPLPGPVYKNSHARHFCAKVGQTFTAQR